MPANYNHITPVGQLDAMACWAACLKFWYKAAFSIKKSQRALIDKYNYLTDDYGAMGDDAMIEIISDNKMYIEEADPATGFTGDLVRNSLRWGPLYVAYTETSSQTRHVNVIHGIVDSGANPRVNVMEPQVTENPTTLTWTGAHQVKYLSEFNTHGNIFFGYK